MGISGPAQQRQARELLHAAGVTRPGRQRVAAHKEARAQAAVVEALAFHCSSEACRTAIADLAEGRAPILVERRACEVCAGSNHQAALERMAQAMAAAGMAKVVVVGGAPTQRTALRDAAVSGVEWRFVDGTGASSSKAAASHLAWADVVAVWGPTPLKHKISDHYSADPKAVTVRQRGIAALADEVARFAAGGAPRA